MGNHFVTPSGAGISNGSTWGAAWASTGISWSSVVAGDIVWISGGSYPNGLNNITVSGVSGNPIIIRKVIATDSVASGVSGLNTGQAIFAVGFFDGAYSGGNSAAIGGSFITVDGHQWTSSQKTFPTSYGIFVNVPFDNVNTRAGFDDHVQTDLTVINVEVAGPPPNTVLGTNGVSTNGYSQTVQETHGIYCGTNCLISGCKLHDMDTVVKSYASNVILEYTAIYNVSSEIQYSGTGPHPDSAYVGGGSITIRYCVIANVVSEGLFWGGDGTYTGFAILYGNLIFSGNTAPEVSDAIEIKTQAATPAGGWPVFSVYNNTFVDCGKSTINNDAVSAPFTSTIPATSVCQNNLFINCSNGMDNFNGPPIICQHNGYYVGRKSQGGSEATAIINDTVVPFVGPYTPNSQIAPALQNTVNTPSGYDPTQYINNFKLTPGTWAMGASTPVSPYNTDMFGNTGSNLGAFQSSGTGDTTPPTVSLTAPSAGTVSGTITVSANAADNVAVAGVTFNVDGTPIQAQDTTAPYSISWNTATIANGTHVLTAVAVDTSNNSTTSASVTVTVANTALIPAFVQVNSATPQAATSPVTVVFTNAQTAGNSNVVIVGFNDLSITLSATNPVVDTKGNVYTVAVPLARGPGTGTTVSQAIYTSHNIAASTAGSNTVTVTFSAAPAFPDIRIAEYSNISTATVYIDSIASASGTGTALSSGALSTTVINDMVVSGNTVGDVTISPAGGFTQRLITGDGDIVEDQLASTVGSYTGSANGGASNNWVMQTVALKAAVSVPTFNPVTVNFTSLAATVDINYLEYRNIVTTSPLDVGSNNSGTSTTPLTPSTGGFTTLNPSDIIVGASTSTTGILSSGTGYTKRTGGTHSCVEDNPVTSTGSYTAGSNITVSSQWIQQAVALKAAGSLSPITVPVTGILSAQAFTIFNVSVPIGVTGISSAQAFGTFSTAAPASRTVTGIASSESFTIYAVSAPASRTITGIVSSESFTAYFVSAPASPIVTGVISGEAFSIASVAAPGLFTVTGIPSAQAFGPIIIPAVAIVTGIVSAQAFGIPTLLSPGQFTVTGITSAETFSTVLIAALASVTGVASAEAFSIVTVTSPGLFTVTGVSSAEAFSTVLIASQATVTGIASAQAFGSVTITMGNVTRVVTGVVSAESFTIYVVNVSGGPSTVSVIGISSSEVLNNPSVNYVGVPTRMIRIL
jgi:Bacterial Ig domain